jgi:plastocyanin
MSHRRFLLNRVRPLGGASAVLGMLFLTLVGVSAVVPRAECAGDPVRVRLSPFGFIPATVTVQAGTVVTWVNEDELPHTVTSAEGAFASQALHNNESFLFRFDVPGTYQYFSGFQPQMTGRIVVR